MNRISANWLNPFWYSSLLASFPIQAHRRAYVLPTFTCLLMRVSTMGDGIGVSYRPSIHSNLHRNQKTE